MPEWKISVSSQSRRTSYVRVYLSFQSVDSSVGLSNRSYLYADVYKESDAGTLTYKGKTYMIDNDLSRSTTVAEDTWKWVPSSVFTFSYDTRYLVKLRCKRTSATNSDGEYIESYPLQLCFVQPWDWADVNGSNATAEQVTAAYNAVYNKEVTRNFSHLVWNDLADKVSKIMYHLNLESDWNEFYDTYSNTLMTDTEEGRMLTATRYNSLKYQPGHIYGTGIPDVSPEEQVIGEKHLLDLVTKINDWINSLRSFIYE